MAKVLMSISPIYFKRIVDGVKLYEFRKRKCRKSIDTIVFYVGKPIGKVYGEVSVGEPLEGEPEKIWELTKEKAGITKEEICAYSEGAKLLYAYPIQRVRLYDKPRKLMEFGKKYPPQMFYYL